MNYEELIETISAMVENEKIYKKGLIIVYELDEKNHKQMNEELFYKSNPTDRFKQSDEFEVEMGGIIVRFVKPKIEISDEDL